MMETRSDTFAAWRQLVDGMSEAGQLMDEATADLSPAERADGFRALARALANQLGRLEADDVSPELAPFNLWRQKFYMDNPDCLYWVAEIASGGRYRVNGVARNAAFTSFNVYASAGLEARTVVRLTTDDLVLDGEGRFSVTLGGSPDHTDGQWAALPEGANMLWVRQFYDEPDKMDGGCAITRLDQGPPPPFIQPERFAKRLGGMGQTLGRAGRVIARAATPATEPPNRIREWSEMQGGAVFTEPGIHYQRGAWGLEPDQALVIEGQAVEARHHSVLLYSRFLNSLDYRHRQVSLAGPRFVTDPDGRFRIVLSAVDPGVPNWLDTEGRPFGLFVLRWLQPASSPPLPTVRVVDLAELGA